MGKSKKAPDYAETTIDTGLYGSSTTNKNGTTFKPTDFQKQIVSTVETNVPALFNNYYNASFDNPDFNKYLETRQNSQTDAFNNSIYNQLKSKGLMTSDGLAGAANSWNNTLNNQKADALRDWQNEQANTMSTLMNLYQIPYSIMSGQTNASQGLSNAITQYNVNKYNAEKAKNGNLFNLLSGLGASAGSFGGFSTNSSGSNQKKSNITVSGTGRGGTYA